MADIIKYPHNSAYLILKAPFYRLCHEIVSDLALKQQFCWQRSAVECLQVAAGEFLMTMPGKLSSSPSKIIRFTNFLFRAGALGARHAGRVTLIVQDR